MKQEKSPLSHLVLRLSSLTQTNHIEPQDNTQKIWPNQISQCYLALNRQYVVADYLTTVTDRKLRKTLTRYRLSEHSLARETGHHRQT